MDSRYEVVEFKGKGVFSSVVRARDLKHRDAATGEHPEVAIKLIRANETMYKAAQTEQAILRQLAAADPENKKHCIRLLRAFEYRNHMCLATEMMVGGVCWWGGVGCWLGLCGMLLCGAWGEMVGWLAVCAVEVQCLSVQVACVVACLAPVTVAAAPLCIRMAVTLPQQRLLCPIAAQCQSL